jgi:hypothetical protein
LLWVATGLIVLIGIIGCQADHNSPTEPVNPVNPAQLMNFWATDAIGDDYTVYYYTEGVPEFEFDIPAGDWIYEYVTDLGSFIIVLRVKQPATLYIGLQPGDIVRTSYLPWPGQIIPGSRVLLTSGPVEIYSWPPEPIPWWEVFIPDEAASSAIKNRSKRIQERLKNR